MKSYKFKVVTENLTARVDSFQKKRKENNNFFGCLKVKNKQRTNKSQHNVCHEKTKTDEDMFDLKLKQPKTPSLYLKTKNQTERSSNTFQENARNSFKTGFQESSKRAHPETATML